MVAGASKTDTDSYFDQTKPDIKALTEKQLKKMQSAMVIMNLVIRWKKPIKLVIELDHENAENAQDMGGKEALRK